MVVYQPDHNGSIARNEVNVEIDYIDPTDDANTEDNQQSPEKQKVPNGWEFIGDFYKPA